MIDLAFKNIARQRTRTFLTVLGIVIGIGAVVALGSISEGLNNEVQQSLELNAGKIIVSEKDSSGFFVGFSGSELTEEHVEDIAGVSGIKEVVPQIYYWETIIPFQGPDWVAIGIQPSKAEFFSGEAIEVEEGRELDDGDTDVIVAGKDFAERYGLEVGDFFTLKETDLEIVGVLEEAGTSNIDGNFIVPLEALQDITDIDFFPVIYAIPEDVRETEILSERIEDENEDLDALTSTDIARQASEIVGQVTVFTIGIGAVAALVGGLGIMNTMIMSVLERRREIGVMKAIGARRRKILLHFMTEALLISAIGGAIGIGLGIFMSRALGAVLGFFSGAVITWELVAGSFLFAIILGLSGGFYPAWKAAKLDPVEALRYE